MAGVILRRLLMFGMMVFGMVMTRVVVTRMMVLGVVFSFTCWLIEVRRFAR